MKGPATPLGFQQLLFTLLLIIIIPGLPGPYLETVLPVLLSIVLVSCLYLVVPHRRELVLGVAIAIPTFLTSFDLPVVPDGIRVLVNLCLYVLFLMYVAGNLFRFLLHARQVNADVICCALCLYLMLGYVWTFLYLLVEHLSVLFA